MSWLCRIWRQSGAAKHRLSALTTTYVCVWLVNWLSLQYPNHYLALMAVSLGVAVMFVNCDDKMVLGYGVIHCMLTGVYLALMVPVSYYYLKNPMWYQTVSIKNIVYMYELIMLITGLWNVGRVAFNGWGAGRDSGFSSVQNFNCNNRTENK